MARAKVAAPLRQEVAQEIKDDLANMVFKPGTRLIERELCDRYAVSRTIIREVLRELECTSLVTTEPAPTIAPSPIVTPFKIVAFIPIHAPSQILTGDVSIF